MLESHDSNIIYSRHAVQTSTCELVNYRQKLNEGLCSSQSGKDGDLVFLAYINYSVIKI